MYGLFIHVLLNSMLVFALNGHRSMFFQRFRTPGKMTMPFFASVKQFPSCKIQ